MNNKIDQETYDKIAEIIHSDKSPVGIDAKPQTYKGTQKPRGNRMRSRS